MSGKVIKERIADTDVEVNMEDGSIQFKFIDPDEGIQEILTFKDGDALLNFLIEAREIRLYNKK